MSRVVKLKNKNVKLPDVPMPPTKKVVSFSKRKNPVSTFFLRRIALFKESKFYINTKHKHLPALRTQINKLFFVMLWSGFILLSFNLFNILQLTIINFLKTIAFYFVLQEVQTYFLRLFTRGRK